jgi:predicted CXXCH cytochrome family protein
MRKKILVTLGVIVSIAMFVGVGALIAADVPDEISVKSKAFETHKKAAVKLSHKKHNVDYKIACAECHHVYKDGKNVFKEGDPVQACSECHDPVKSEGKVKKLMLAYHKNCQGCHKDLEAAGKPTGPTKKCNDCHVKE